MLGTENLDGTNDKNIFLEMLEIELELPSGLLVFDAL
jgi:hypothetical protein